MKATEAAYLAGIIDGEGSISLTRVGGKEGYWKIVVAVSSCDRDLIEWLSQWGGSTIYDMNRGENRRLQHRWTIVGNSVRYVLRRALPYLIIKRERAEWALEGLAIIGKPRKPWQRRSEADADKLLALRAKFDNDRGRTLAARKRVYS